MALVKYCPVCHGLIHYLMPWMRNHRKIHKGKHRGKTAHKIDQRTGKCKYGD